MFDYKGAGLLGLKTEAGHLMNKSIVSIVINYFIFFTWNYMKQAGAELGQAQHRLGLKC